MKSNLVNILILLCLTIHVKNQSSFNYGNYYVINNQSYQSLKSFNGDTLNYIKTNFIDRKAIYLYQPLSKLIRACEIPFKCYIVGGDQSNIKFASYLYLQIYKPIETYYRNKEKKDPAVIVIYWEKPLSNDLMTKLIRTDHGIWTGVSKIYFQKQIVKDIQLVKYDFDKAP